MMTRLFMRLQAFLFTPVSALGFGLMRSGWAATSLAFFLMQWKDVTEFYSSAGVLPPILEPLVTRPHFRFTLLDVFPSPEATHALYALLLVSLLCSMLGILPRIATITGWILMASFHERNTLILGGGDTVLRTIGFLLCIAPTLSAFSITRWRRRRNAWLKDRTDLPEPRMSIWPYRLLLWQMIVLYGTSVWIKFTGTMWIAGTAATAALQHEMFVRLSHDAMRTLLFFGPFLTYFALVFESVWLLLLMPRSFTRWALKWEFQPRLKRWLLIIGFLFHLGILLIMDVGVFSVAMFAAYLGLLLEEDFDAMRASFNRRFRGPIAVLYDGQCGLCLRSVFTLHVLDWLRRLNLVDFRDGAARKAHGSNLSLEALDKALHIILPDGRTLAGFDAFRALAWHLPPLWPLAPLLYIPGIPPIGRRIYARIADRRKRCLHQHCGL